MPMRERNFDRFVDFAVSDVPSTVISPFWNGSSPLTVLMSVLLPDPDGQHTTTISPLATLVVHLVSP